MLLPGLKVSGRGSASKGALLAVMKNLSEEVAGDSRAYLSISAPPTLCPPILWGLGALGSTHGVFSRSFLAGSMHSLQVPPPPALPLQKGTECCLDAIT